MRGVLITTMFLIWAIAALAQPADCLEVRTPGSTMQLGIDLAGPPGVAPGTTGRVYVGVPTQAPQTDCGDPATPADVLSGEPGDLLLGPQFGLPSRL